MRNTLIISYAVLVAVSLYGSHLAMSAEDAGQMEQQESRIESPGSIVRCGPGHLDSEGKEIECGKEQFFILIHTLIRYAIYLSALAVSVAITYAGFMYMISAGEYHKLYQAKGAVTAAIIGLVIVLSAWIVVNTVLGIFGCSNWNVFSPATTSTICKGI